MSTVAPPSRLTSRVGPRAIDQFIEAQEVERARIARELHDSVGQKVAMLQIALSQIRRTLPLHEQQAQLQQLSAQVADIARELHEISYELHPFRLESLGLANALGALCEDSARQSGIEITFLCAADPPRAVGAKESLCLYRVAQEALHNVVKHSKAARACVQLVAVGGDLRLAVVDTGQGFDTSVPTNGSGLTNMRQRVALLNGTITVQTRSGGGTRICVCIPH